MELFDYDGTGSATPLASGPTWAWSLSEDQWDVVRRYAAERRYPANAAILAAGAADDALHVVLAGSIAVSARQGAGVLQAGDAFGVAAFLDGGPSPLAATARTAATVLVLSRTGLEQLASWTPQVALALLRDVGLYAARRLRAAGLAV